MSRENNRAKKKLEVNPILECNQMQQKVFPQLFQRFEEIEEPRNESYIEVKLGEYLPHHVTLNDYLEWLNPVEIEKIQHEVVYHMIRKRVLMMLDS